MKPVKLLFILTFCFCIASGFSIQTQNNNTFDLIIQMEDEGQNPASALRASDELKVQTQRVIYADLLIYHVSLETPLNLFESINAIKRNEAIKFVSEDLVLEDRETTPNDPFIGTQIHHDYINSKAAWDISTDGITVDGREAVIAIYETGFSPDHEDLVGTSFTNELEVPNDGLDNDENGFIDDYHGYNVLNMNDVHPTASHGSSVHGIIGALGNNDKGGSGVMWNSSLLLVSNVTNISRILEAMAYVKKMRQDFNESNGAKGAFIVATNLSKGAPGVFPETQPIWCSAYDDLGSVGILSIVASPNSNVDIDEDGDLPSLCPSEFIISVTRTTFEDVLQNGGYGSTSVDMSALGFDVHTTGLNNEYDSSFKGTSAATPQVTGTIGLIYGAMCIDLLNQIDLDPAAGALIVKSLIQNNVTTITSLQDKTTTEGKLNVAASVIAARDYCGVSFGAFGIENLYPNPTPDVTRLYYQTMDEKPVTIKIYNPVGKMVWEDTVIPPPIFEKVYVLDFMDKFPNGLYYLSLTSGEEKACRSFVKINGF